MEIVAIRPLSRDVGVAHAVHYKSDSTDVLQERSASGSACIESMIANGLPFSRHCIDVHASRRHKWLGTGHGCFRKGCLNTAGHADVSNANSV
jgi:hypothetical protein